VEGADPLDRVAEGGPQRWFEAAAGGRQLGRGGPPGRRRRVDAVEAQRGLGDRLVATGGDVGDQGADGVAGGGQPGGWRARQQPGRVAVRASQVDH
jgi:hypothetical protein